MKFRSVFFTRDAFADLESGRDFYDKSSEATGNYFVASLLADIESLSFYSGIHPVVHEFYRMLAQRFPYAVYYDLQNDEVLVVAILDMRKKPARTLKRLRSINKNRVSDTVDGYNAKPANKTRERDKLQPAKHPVGNCG